MKHRVLHLVAPFAVILLFAGCATMQLESWTDPAFQGRPMGKVMVAGMAESQSLQRQYESMFISSLAEAGADAVAAGDRLPADTKVTKAGLQAKLEDEGVASLLVTRVIDEKEKAQYYPPVSYPSYYGGSFGYYSHTFDYVHSPGYMNVYLEIHLETNLYDVPTGKLVWSGRKKITDERSDEKVMKEVIGSTVKDLKKNGLL